MSFDFWASLTSKKFVPVILGLKLLAFLKIYMFFQLKTQLPLVLKGHVGGFVVFFFGQLLQNRSKMYLKLSISPLSRKY